ncbi:hypothetical protein [Campylobacter jejuni]|nr:hypothetical protein [Campylobacter jejuni]
MHNPNSAIERVKNHLAYKLGQAMIDFTNSSSIIKTKFHFFWFLLYNYNV